MTLQATAGAAAAADGAAAAAAPAIGVLPAPACELGESPAWLPERGGELWWVDIAGRALHRWRAADGLHTRFDWPDEPGCLAPLPGGCFLVAHRGGLSRFDPATGERVALAGPPYDPSHQRFNDGKADPQGRFWAGSVCEPREPAVAALWRWAGAGAARQDAAAPGAAGSGPWLQVAAGASTSNGLAWSPDGRTMLWSDTPSHRVHAFDVDPADGRVTGRRVFAEFAGKPADGSLAGYGGRPDGAAMDAEGFCWVAMYEGARLVRLAPDGRVEREVALPVRCPTMPAFGGADLRTLHVTTARKGRPEDELAREPLAGRVLVLRVDVPGLPVNYAAPLP